MARPTKRSCIIIIIIALIMHVLVVVAFIFVVVIKVEAISIVVVCATIKRIDVNADEWGRAAAERVARDAVIVATRRRAPQRLAGRLRVITAEAAVVTHGRRSESRGADRGGDARWRRQRGR